MTDTEPTEPTPTEETPQEEEIVNRGASIVPMRASADALADLPNVPGSDEWRVLAQYARVMAASGIVPRSLQGKPADCLVVLMTGRDLGIPITSAIRKVYVIDGQPSIAPQLKLALIRQKGLGSVRPHPDNATAEDRAMAIAYGPDGRQLGPPAVFSWADAVTAGLVREGCSPSHHTEECNRARAKDGVRQSGATGANFCKDNWRRYPKRQLWWRCAGSCADDYFSEATLGIYSVDELGGMTDEDGNLIDVNSVDMPEGFERPGRGNSSGGGEAGPLVADEDAWRLQERVYALPDEAKAAYAERWKNMPALAGMTIRNHPAAKTALAESLLRGVEAQWKARGEFGPEAALESLRADLAGVVSGLWLVLTPPAAAPVEPEPFAAVAPAPSAPPEEPAAPETAETASKPAEAPTDPDPANVKEPANVPRGTKGEPEPDAVDAAIAEVKHMDLGDVKKELMDRDLSARGAEASVRLRLAMRLAEERGAPMQPTLGGAGAAE